MITWALVIATSLILLALSVWILNNDAWWDR